MSKRSSPPESSASVPSVRVREISNQPSPDTPKLIGLVQQRECIWKKEFRNNFNARRQAWDEVAEQIHACNWEVLTSDEKREATVELQRRWKNIKDSFLKEFKNRRRGVKTKRKYIFYDLLLFLKSEIEKDPRNKISFANETTNYTMDSCSSSVCTESVKEDTNFESFTYETTCPSPSPPSPKCNEIEAVTHRRTQVIRHKTKKSLTSVQFRTRLLQLMQQQNEINAKTTSPQPCSHNDDEAFFQSLLPMVRKLDDFQKLQFRMDVLSSLRTLHNAERQSQTMNVANLTGNPQQQQQTFYPIGPHQMQMFAMAPGNGELSTTTNGGHV